MLHVFIKRIEEGIPIIASGIGATPGMLDEQESLAGFVAPIEE